MTKNEQKRMKALERAVGRLQDDNNRLYSLLSGDEGGMIGDAAKLRDLICKALRGV